MLPAAIGETTVTLSETAFAVAGIPQRPAIASCADVPAPSDELPAGLRESNARQGVTV